MKKVLLLALVAISIFLGYSFGFGRKDNQIADIAKPKTEILKIGLVADSENENELLAKALSQVAGIGVNFVIGLGDWSTVGTVEQLAAAKKVFDDSKLPYFVTSGDHDLWESRDKKKEALTNFNEVFGKSSQVFDRENVRFVIVDDSNIYKGISAEDWQIFSESVGQRVSESVSQKASGSETQTHRITDAPDHQITETPNHRLTFVFAHKTPFHPESKHVMGENNSDVANQAKRFMSLMEGAKVDGFFSGDLHFFAKYLSPSGSVKITTIGAVANARNFQGPRFGILTVWDDYNWQVEDVEIR